jgi:hypothetical protein
MSALSAALVVMVSCDNIRGPLAVFAIVVALVVVMPLNVVSGPLATLSPSRTVTLLGLGDLGRSVLVPIDDELDREDVLARLAPLLEVLALALPVRTLLPVDRDKV